MSINLENHPMPCKRLISMVIVGPIRIGSWDPFQMGFFNGIYMGGTGMSMVLSN